MATIQRQQTTSGGSVTGLSSAVSPGWLAFVVWHAIMNACPKPWQVFICWRLLCSCCIALPFLWLIARKVHNRL
jgi:hypothetical protein